MLSRFCEIADLARAEGLRRLLILDADAGLFSDVSRTLGSQLRTRWRKRPCSAKRIVSGVAAIVSTHVATATATKLASATARVAITATATAAGAANIEAVTDARQR